VETEISSDPEGFDFFTVDPPAFIIDNDAMLRCFNMHLAAYTEKEKVSLQQTETTFQEVQHLNAVVSRLGKHWTDQYCTGKCNETEFIALRQGLVSEVGYHQANPEQELGVAAEGQR